MPPRLERLPPIPATVEAASRFIDLSQVARHDLWSGTYEVQLGRKVNVLLRAFAHPLLGTIVSNFVKGGVVAKPAPFSYRT
jgi:hypothetical protein